MRRFLIVSFLLLSLSCLAGGKGKELKLLYWNIQNGMWHDQGNGYDGFVAYVRSLDPDICVWCEAASRYVTDSAVKMKMPEDQYLPWNWDILAARYGHPYTLICGERDTFPQVITSKYPLRIVRRITGDGQDLVVLHGAGWARVDLGKGRELNLVTVHTSPQKGADNLRAAEVRYVCEQTIGTVPGAENQLWLMTGDFNAISSVDNFHYGRPADDAAFLVHDYVRQNTPYIDLVERFYPGEFKKSTLSGRRIDMVYVTPALFRLVSSATPLYDGFAASVRDPRGKEVNNFCHPSDHYPILVTIKFR